MRHFYLAVNLLSNPLLLKWAMNEWKVFASIFETCKKRCIRKLSGKAGDNDFEVTVKKTPWVPSIFELMR